MESHVFIGVDGGGTKTNFVCIDQNGTILSSCSGPSSNWNSVGESCAKAALCTGILKLLETTNPSRTIDHVRGICLGMAGVDRVEDKSKVRNWISELFTKAAYRGENSLIKIENDAVIALSSGTSGSLYGVVVISGTGMISYGLDKQGNERRSGGWGPLFGDQGSGYAIGQEILRAVVSEIDGRGEKTMLSIVLLRYLSLEKVSDLIPWAYDKADQSWKKFADLAPLAMECALQNDQVSKRILENAAEELLCNISAVTRGLYMEKEEFPLVFAGGNLTHKESPLAKLLISKAQERFPFSRILFPSIEPEMAAALIAKNQFSEHQKSL